MPSSIILPRGQEEITVAIETLEDSSYRGTGRIKLQLDDNPDRYVLDDATNYGINFVDIHDNEPSFSIVALRDSIVEGEDLTFTISVDRGVSSAQPVTITLTGDTSFIAGELTHELEFLPTLPSQDINHCNIEQ